MTARDGFVLAATAVLALAVTARGDTPMLSQPAVDALTAIDQTPTNAELAVVLAQPPLDNLVEIAAGSPSIDPGVQLRAIHALTQYTTNPTDQASAHLALTNLLADPQYASALDGTNLLILRAAIEAYGTVARGGTKEDVDEIDGFLNNGSQDVRTTTARALRDMGLSQAILPLRTRYGEESVQQVKLAISEALRVLPQVSD